MSTQLGRLMTTLQYHHSRGSKMGEGSKSKTTKVTSRMPVSALSAECKFKEIILRQFRKVLDENFLVCKEK